MTGKDLKNQPLLFVNSNPEKGGTFPHRRAIYQHVQLRYAKWKHGKKAPQTRQLSATSEENDDGSARYRSNASACPDEDTSSAEPALKPKPNIGKRRPIYRHTPGPVTMLQRGNSDPFSALAVTVSPNTNALMEFTRDYYLPGIQRDITNPGQRVIAPEWIACISFLRDQGLAYSHFARIATVLASDPSKSDISGDFHTQALLFKSKGISMLRERMMVDPGDPRTYNQIFLLMNAELYDRNLAAASAHAKILAKLFENGTIKNDLAFLFKVVYHDAQRATMSLTTTMLDLEDWVPNQLIPMDRIVPANHPSAIWMGPLGLNLDASLDSNPSLKKTMKICKHNCLSLLLALKDKAYADAKVVFYGRFYTTLCMGRLVNHYLDAVALLNKHSSNWIVEKDPINPARMSAYLSLAVILLLRCLTRIDNVKISGNITIFNANMLLMHRLKETLMVVDGYPQSDLIGEFAGSRLFALFVSAWLEQRKSASHVQCESHAPGYLTDCSSSGAGLGWFSCALAEQACTMGLYAWTDVRDVLQRFIYADVLEPNGSLWFPWIVLNHKTHVS